MTQIDAEFAPVLITGAGGFIGRALTRRLASTGIEVRAMRRDAHGASAQARVVVADVTRPASLRGVCDGVHTIFHLAGYAHADDADTPAAANLHERITVEGTAALLAEAERAGVHRFVFASSVKAMGEGGAQQLDESSPMLPQGAYGRAKQTAERAILASGQRRGTHACVLRFPLVYGPAQRGNLARMVHAVAHGRFPPIPETGNRRSMLHVEDAVSALLLAARHATARDQIYIATDARAYSTREILNQIHLAFGHPVPTWSIPRTLLSAIATAGSVLGAATGARMPLTRDALDKLLGSAWYSSEKIRRELGFSSRYDFATALPDIVRWYNEHGMPKNTEHREGWLE